MHLMSRIFLTYEGSKPVDLKTLTMTLERLRTIAAPRNRTDLKLEIDLICSSLVGLCDDKR